MLNIVREYLQAILANISFYIIMCRYLNVYILSVLECINRINVIYLRCLNDKVNISTIAAKSTNWQKFNKIQKKFLD